MNFKRTINIALLKLKKYSPEIMVVAGCAGTVAAGVMACKETLKLGETLDKCKEEIENVELLNANGDFEDEQTYKKELTVQTVKNALTVGKLYAPAAALGTASICLILGSNNIMRKRNASLAAAYMTLDSMYKKYRQNVVETFGKEIDHDMRFGVSHETIEEVVVDEKGKERTVKKTVEVIDNFNQYSDYARFFDETCISWDKNPEYNLMFLKTVETYCNNLLKANGYLFLNDVYKQIGIEPSIAGQTVGWIYDEECPVGDNYVDFGLYREDNESARRFVNGLENVILLDFNVDGDILNDSRLKLWKI